MGVLGVSCHDAVGGGEHSSHGAFYSSAASSLFYFYFLAADASGMSSGLVSRLRALRQEEAAWAWTVVGTAQSTATRATARTGSCLRTVHRHHRPTTVQPGLSCNGGAVLDIVFKFSFFSRSHFILCFLFRTRVARPGELFGVHPDVISHPLLLHLVRGTPPCRRPEARVLRGAHHSPL